MIKEGGERMKSQGNIRLSIDLLMTAALLFVSGYQFWGEMVHEWVGAGLFVLFIAHQFLNLSWYKHLLKGRYTPLRILQFAIASLVLAAMLMQMYSGIVLSRYVFDFLPLTSGLALARRLHILGAYWGILLMSLHLGIHWQMIIAILRKRTKITSPSKIRSAICTGSGLVIAGYGLLVLNKRDFLTYLLLRSEFVFLDYSEPVLLFYRDYLALMGLCIFIAHYLAKLCRKFSTRKETAQ